MRYEGSNGVGGRGGGHSQAFTLGCIIPGTWKACFDQALQRDAGMMGL
jgi:hypothetical protein